MEPSKKTYRKNISNDDVFDLIEAIRKHPILWADIRIGSGLFDNIRIAWNAVMATLKNKTISLIQATLKWRQLKSKYFRLKESGVMALKRWKFSQSLNFLDQINGELRLDGSETKAKKRTKAVSDWDKDYNKRQSARSAAVTTGKLSTSRSQRHNGDKLKTAKTERKTKSVSVTTTETSLLPTGFRPGNPNETFCEYLLGELNWLTESKSRHLRRLLLQTMYDFFELPDV